jgi:nucleotide-binding universal stress UspA family protein
MANKQPVIVPWDFTHITRNAFLHALKLTETKNNPIILLNIVKKEKEVETAEIELEKAKKEIVEKYNTSVEITVKVGSIFSTIAEYALEVDALMVLMGTHGIQGMQKLTGSWALKVIASSKIPFIVIQGPPKSNNYTNIVFPIDFKSESKEKLQWVKYLAENFNSKVSVLVPNTSDKLIANKINANLNFAKKYLEGKDINYEITSSMAKGSFAKQTLDFARYIDADIIAIVITKDISINDYVFGAEEQQIIANNLEIPVICINPRSDTLKYSPFLGR